MNEPKPSTSEGPAIRRTLSFRGRPLPVAYAAFMLLLVGWGLFDLLAARGWRGHGLLSILFWMGMSGLTNILPVPAIRRVYLSMSSAVNLAIAFLFPPSLTLLTVFVGSVSQFEIKRQTQLVPALFNRAQLALSAALASMIFSLSSDELPPAALLFAAIAVYHMANFAFVTAWVLASGGVPAREAVRSLLPPSPFAGISYLALGLMGLVYGLVFERIGAWAVVILTIPLLVGRFGLEVARRLQQAERDRRMLSERLIDERERERVRIAGEIHNVTLQDLAALQIQADNIRSAIEAADLRLAAAMTEQTKAKVSEIISDLRGVIANLRRVALDQEGLVPTLERYARSFTADTGLEIQIRGDGVVDQEIPLPVGLLLYECVQEALTNVARHAEASRADVLLAKGPEGLRLVVRDDGKGMEDAGREEGQGLKLTRDKVHLSGGRFWIESRQRWGTEVNVQVPIREEE